MNNRLDNTENQFKLIGLDAFFNVEDDKSINWAEFFQLTEDEQFFAANNNQIIGEDKAEDQKWNKL